MLKFSAMYYICQYEFSERECYTHAHTYATLSDDPAEVLDWPTISEVKVLKGPTAFDQTIIQWKIGNYTDFLTFTFTKNDGTVIDPNKDGYKLHWDQSCSVSALCLQLKLPYLFSGKIKLSVKFNASVTTRATGFLSINVASPSISPSKISSDSWKLHIAAWFYD